MISKWSKAFLRDSGHWDVQGTSVIRGCLPSAVIVVVTGNWTTAGPAEKTIGISRQPAQKKWDLDFSQVEVGEFIFSIKHNKDKKTRTSSRWEGGGGGYWTWFAWAIIQGKQTVAVWRIDVESDRARRGACLRHGFSHCSFCRRSFCLKEQGGGGGGRTQLHAVAAGEVTVVQETCNCNRKCRKPRTQTIRVHYCSYHVFSKRKKNSTITVTTTTSRCTLELLPAIHGLVPPPNNSMD